MTSKATPVQQLQKQTLKNSGLNDGLSHAITFSAVQVAQISSQGAVLCAGRSSVRFVLFMFVRLF